jgi:hypothetical protein
MALLVSDVGPTPATFSPQAPYDRSGSGRILSLAVAADGNRVYAGSYSGLWRSDDAGRTFRQMSRGQSGTFDVDVPGALHAPHLFDLAVSPANPDIVLAAAVRSQFKPPRDGIYRSADGGQSWTLVLPAFRVGQIAFAPDDPGLVIATIGNLIPFTTTFITRLAISHDGGVHWRQRALNPAWHVAIGPLEAGGARRVYATGDNTIWRSIDGGVHWRADAGASVIVASRAATSAFIKANGGDAIGVFGAGTGDVSATGAQALALDPGNPELLYLAGSGGTFGPSYFATRADGTRVPDGTGCNTTRDRLAGEGSLWFGDFSAFNATKAAQWQAVPGPPVYSGATMPGGYAITPSGTVFVQTRRTASGYLVFFADLASVHVAVGRPMATTAWHRLSGRDASFDARAGELYDHPLVHHDPHALVTTADFDVTLKPAFGVASPYNQNSELDQHLGGTIWMANDGGVQWSDNGGETWIPANGLPTLDPINIAGVAGLGPTPALYIGTGDNDSFFSTDGGVTWRDPSVHLGDADAWFADIAQATRVLQFAPRGGGLALYTSGGYPDGTDSARIIPPPAGSNCSSGFVLRGYAPLVRTLATELAPDDGDIVVIGTRSDGARVVFRTQRISTISASAEWEDPSHAQQEGPPLPDPAPGMVVGIVQASGGHLNPAIFISDAVSLWSLDRTAQAWRLLVPGGPPGRSASTASRFWVDPFNPLVIYLLDFDRLRVSLDGGASWVFDADLTRAISGGGKLDLSQPRGAFPTVLRDILFVRTEPFTRFAFGSAGVMCTVDGVVWQTLLNAVALGGCPESGFFDGITDPLDRTLYVELEGRSILRISGVPAPPILSSSDFSLMDLAAILAEA